MTQFGRKGNTPISDVAYKPNSKNFNNNKITKYYLDEETKLGRTYLSDEQWTDTEMCSDVEMEKVICAANA